MFRDEFSRLLLTGTTILCLGCLLIIGIPVYYDIVPHEGAWASTLNRHSAYPDLDIYKYAGPQAEAVYDTLGGSTPGEAGMSTARQSAFLPQARPENAPFRQPDVPAIVLQVVDGDSIAVSIPSFPPILGSNISVGLATYDSPDEFAAGSRLHARNAEAKAMTASMLPPGSVVWLRDIHRDTSFGLLARVEVEGVDVGAELSARGIAWPETKNGGSLRLANGKNYPAHEQKPGASCQLSPGPDTDE